MNIKAIHTIKPNIAGTKIDLPASPPNTTLQVILATAINISTDTPIHILHFQNAMAKAARERGTKDESMIFPMFQ